MRYLVSLSQMDLRQLKALVAIADNGSFSAAADVLLTVQSNVSAHVKKLERELGTTLVDRSSGTLTSTGELAVARARRVEAELTSLQADIRALQHEVTGTVRVGIIGTTARWLVPQLLDVSPLRFPDLRLVFVESTTRTLEGQLDSGYVDVAVLNVPHTSHDLLLVPLFEEELVLVAERGHPLLASGKVKVHDLAGIPLLLPLKGTAFRKELDDAVAPLDVALTARAEVDSTRLIASLTFEGYGPAILPATAIPMYLRDRWASAQIAEIPPRIVGVAQRPRTLPSAPVRAVLDMLTEIVFDSPALPWGLRAMPPDRFRTWAPSSRQVPAT